MVTLAEIGLILIVVLIVLLTLWLIRLSNRGKSRQHGTTRPKKEDEFDPFNESPDSQNSEEDDYPIIS